MMKKIIAVGLDAWQSRFEKKVLEHFQNKIELEFWSIGCWVYDDWNRTDEVTKYRNGVLYRYINNTSTVLRNTIKYARKDVIFLFDVGYIGRKINALQILIKILGGKYIVSFVPAGVGDSRMYDALPDKRLIDIFPPEAVFISNISHKGFLPSKRACETWKIVATCSLNYEVFLKNEKQGNARMVESKYVVFLDENLPFHIEAIVNKRPWLQDAKKYFEQLNKLFDLIENIFSDKGIEVVIAAHPAAKSDLNKYDFAGRKIIFDNTVNLVKYAEFAIAYACTSVDFAVLYDKPVLYYTSEDLDTCNVNTTKGINYKIFKDFFNPKYIKIDKIEENIQIEDYLFWDKEKYTFYKENYLYSKELRGRSHFEIIMDYVLGRG